MRYVGHDTVVYKHGDEVKIVEPSATLHALLEDGDAIIVPVNDTLGLRSKNIMLVTADELRDKESGNVHV